MEELSVVSAHPSKRRRERVKCPVRAKKLRGALNCTISQLIAASVIKSLLTLALSVGITFSPRAVMPFIEQTTPSCCEIGDTSLYTRLTFIYLILEIDNANKALSDVKEIQKLRGNAGKVNKLLSIITWNIRNLPEFC